MSDEVRRLELELRRQGRDPADYALEILKLAPAKFFFLAQFDGASMPVLRGRARELAESYQKKTVVWTETFPISDDDPPTMDSRESWNAYWAWPVCDVEDLATLAESFGSYVTALWSVDRQRWINAPIGLRLWAALGVRLEDGWRDPVNSSYMGNDRFGVFGGNVTTSSAPRCSFCSTTVGLDGVSCACPPCVNRVLYLGTEVACGGPHPAQRCPLQRAEDGGIPSFAFRTTG